MDKLTLVTVVGPDGPAEVALPTTATIGALIPQIAEICVRRPPDDVDLSSWTIGPVGGPPFSVAASVAQLGVTEGDVLELREQSDPPMELIGSDAGVAVPSAEAPPGETAAEASPPGPAGEPPVAAVDTPGPVEAPPALAAPPVREPSVLERTRAVLPRPVTLGARVGAAAGAVAPPPAVPRARPALEPAVTAPSPRPGDLTRRRTPVLTDRVRTAWRLTDYQRRLDEAIALPRLGRCATIAVLSPKGGVGKTTITALLGALFALVRADRVIAVDTNPDFGTLGRSLSPEHGVFVDDILDYLEHPALTITTLDSCLGRAADGLMVLPTPTDPERMARLDQAAYTRVIERLKALVGIAVLDCGTGLWDPATRAAIACADQLVVVSDDEPTTATVVIEACQLLRAAGPPVTVVVNRWRRRSRLDLEAVAAHASGATGLIVVPEERAGALRVANGRFSWEDAPAAWRVRLRELAVLLVSGWEALGVTAVPSFRGASAAH